MGAPVLNMIKPFETIFFGQFKKLQMFNFIVFNSYKRFRIFLLNKIIE